MAGFIGWGIALIVIGLILSFANVFGVAIGAPLIYLGWLLILVGIVLAIVHFVTGTGRAATRRI